MPCRFNRAPRVNGQGDRLVGYVRKSIPVKSPVNSWVNRLNTECRHHRRPLTPTAWSSVTGLPKIKPFTPPFRTFPSISSGSGYLLPMVNPPSLGLRHFPLLETSSTALYGLIGLPPTTETILEVLCQCVGFHISPFSRSRTAGDAIGGLTNWGSASEEFQLYHFSFSSLYEQASCCSYPIFTMQKAHLSLHTSSSYF